MTISEYKAFAREEMQDIEDLLKRKPKEQLKIFREINSLLSAWSEYNHNSSDGRNNDIAPKWFYPYINNL